MADTIAVEVVYALPTQQHCIALRVAEGCTVREAVEQSGILQRVPDWHFDSGKLGIYSRLASPEDVVHDRDRIELYRPLVIDPKEARRQRAKKNK